MPILPSTTALLVALVLSSAASAQTAGPRENQGAVSKSLGSIQLSTETEGTSGSQLRARTVTIEPGGHTAAHSHKGRPTLEYVLEGEVVEIRNGVEIPHGPGDLVKGTGDVTHWWENHGTSRVVLMPFDVFTP